MGRDYRRRVDSKKFLEDVRPRKAEGARQSIYLTPEVWKEFKKHCGHIGASLVLEHFIRLFNEGMKDSTKKD